MRQKAVQIIKKALKELKVSFESENIDEVIEIPKDYSMGDFAFPCFVAAKELKMNPHEIALELRESIGTNKDFKEIQVAGPYLNFFRDKINLATNLTKEIIKSKGNFGKSNLGKNKKIMVEFPSPNTNKPLHLGHLRNISIGESISRISEANGFKVFRTNLNNDRGIHICKSMAGYIKYAKNDQPTKERKGDHLVGDFYVKFNEKSKKDKELEILSHRLLQKYEEGDRETIQLWKTMNKWALDGFKETYEKFGIKFNKEYFESNLYQKGKEIIMDGLKKGIFEKDKEGAIKINLEKEKLGEKVLLRQDGTSIYITQDIYLAKLKMDEFKLDQSLYVVGNEQEYHFNVLFSILDKLGIGEKNKLKHISYGMVNLPEGKMKSREGTVVDADDLIDKLQKLVKKELSQRGKLSEKELEKRSLVIALAAIKYFLLKVDLKKNMMFNPKESISFEGDTGPYLLYSYARASSILRKAKKSEKIEIPKELEEKEIELTKKLSEFPALNEKAYTTMNPALIANYSKELSKIFNEFYHACPVIGSENEGFRLDLIKSFRQVIKNALNLLGIETLEEM